MGILYGYRKNVEDPTKISPLDKMGAIDIKVLDAFGCRVFIPLGISYMMLNREITYLREGRPNKQTYQKRYRSDIREHAIEGRPIGNPEFHIIFSEMGIALSALRKLEPQQVPDFYVMTKTEALLAGLERLWEDRHGEPFKSNER